MLRTLAITNYALIEHLELDFGPGLTIITGETGAGKSIMLGALQLVMGGRSDAKSVMQGAQKATVEATFSGIDSLTSSLLATHGIETEEDEEGAGIVTIRREIWSTGRTRAYINDISVTIATLNEIAPRLIDIHSQHANAKINSPAERLAIIDALAGNEELRKNYRDTFEQYVELRREIANRRAAIEEGKRNVEILRFKLSRLDALQPRVGELAEIENRFELLSDADEVKNQLNYLCSLISDTEPGAGALVSTAAGVADKISGISSEKERSLAARLKEIEIELKDIRQSAEQINNGIDTDPATIAGLSARMNLYYENIKFFNADDADSLATLHATLRDELSMIDSGDTTLPEMEKELRQLAHKVKEQAELLTQSRQQTATTFSNEICEKARPLGLHNIKFEAVVTPKKLGANGGDEVEFICTFNKNSEMRPVTTIASGGEISRLMLSMKAILAGHLNLPTIIFDEVDTGVSGDVASKMGAMMQSISEAMQVVAITHLPQVAAKGRHHLRVYKLDTGSRTVTHVDELTTEARIREIAGMISGSEMSSAAIEAAKELLK